MSVRSGVKRRSTTGVATLGLAVVLCVAGCAYATGLPESVSPTGNSSVGPAAEQPAPRTAPPGVSTAQEGTARAIQPSPDGSDDAASSRSPLPQSAEDVGEGVLAPITQGATVDPDPLVIISELMGTDAGAPVGIQLLQPDAGRAGSYAAAGVDLVTLELGWDAYQPTAGTTNRSYVARRVAEAQGYAAAGLEVVLDLGLQYPPAWAWDLPGETRFINQYGEQWRGGIGTDPLDAVWNSAAREAQGRYVEAVARDFRGIVDRVRVGGLLSGEIRLPPANGAGHVDSLWAFGRGALSAAPDPTWRPGSGTEAQARQWLDFYMSSVSGYAVWLTGTVGSAFPATPIDVLLPGWGVRPGDLDRVAAASVSRAAVASTGDDLAGGLDWPRQLRALDRLGLDLTAVTTWLDAPSYGTAPRDLAPVEYLVTLTRPLGMPISGENTGGNGAAALARVREQAHRLNLGRITWMPDGTPGDVTPADLGRSFPG